MPLYSDLYSTPSSSYTSFYLPGPYSNHSSILASNYRSPFSKSLAPRTFARGYIPHLSTITESQVISPLRRNFSPKFLLQHHSSTKYTAPKPIKINTADIDVSVNKYRKYDRKTIDIKKSPEKSKSPSPTSNSPNSNNTTNNISINSSENAEVVPDNKGIRRDRPLVRLRTVHKKDSPKKQENDSAPKSWRQNFYADELNKVEDKKPKLSPGELLKEKFLIKTKEEERLLQEGRRAPRKYTRKLSAPKKSSDFHEICRVISSDTIDEDLNPGIIEESAGDENNNNNIKRKKKAVRKKSNDKFIDCENKSNLQRRPTQKKLRRQSVDSVVSDIVDDDAERAYQEAIRDVSQVEIAEIQLPNTRIIATIDVQPSPSLKAVVDKVEIVESPKKLNKKFKFNVIVEDVINFDNAGTPEALPESKLDIGQGAIAIKRERSKSPKIDRSSEVVEGKVKSAQLKSGVRTKISPKLNKGLSGKVLTELNEKNKLKGKAKLIEIEKEKLSEIKDVSKNCETMDKTFDLKQDATKINCTNLITQKLNDKNASTVIKNITNKSFLNKEEIKEDVVKMESSVAKDESVEKKIASDKLIESKLSAQLELPHKKGVIKVSTNLMKSNDFNQDKSLINSDKNKVLSKEKVELPTPLENVTPLINNQDNNSDFKSKSTIDTVDLNAKQKDAVVQNNLDSSIRKLPTLPEPKLVDSPKPKLSNQAKEVESPKLLKNKEAASSASTPNLNLNQKSKVGEQKTIKTPKLTPTPTKQEDSQFPLFSSKDPEPSTKLAPKEENKSGENFWEKIGTRESVYYDKRKKTLQEKRKALFENSFNEVEEEDNKSAKILEKPNQGEKVDVNIKKPEVAIKKIVSKDQNIKTKEAVSKTTTDIEDIVEPNFKVPEKAQLKSEEPKVPIKTNQKLEINNDVSTKIPVNVSLKPATPTSEIQAMVPSKEIDSIIDNAVPKTDTNNLKLNNNKLTKSSQQSMTNETKPIEEVNNKQIPAKKKLIKKQKSSDDKAELNKSKLIIQKQQPLEASKIIIKTLTEPPHQNAVQTEELTPVISGEETATKTMSNKLNEENSKNKDKKVIRKIPVRKAEDTKKPVEDKKDATLEINNNTLADSNEEVKVGKKVVSKGSLVNKSCIEDPDLQVFVLPKEAQVVQQKEPSPPKFVPLQSNRISQFMHPFKKPEQFDECPVQIFARPKTIRHRHYPKPRGHTVPEKKEEVKPVPISDEKVNDESDEDEEESSEEEATDDDDDSDETSSDSVDLDELNDVWGYGKVGASTSSDDSGFDSSSYGNRKNKGCSERDSPTSNPAHNPAFALDPAELSEELYQSRTFVGFQKSGRITPPATTIPRFRKYNIEDFNFLKVLGKGSFGKVLLAELKDTEYYYAIKCLKKDVVLEDDDVECTLIERKVLALGTKHPYLCHLLCTFQTESHLFFVMEYLNGGDLMFHIQQSGRFPEPRARFYAAEIVSGLKFLHGKGIVYRDLKLDNILLDFDGHVRIADFGMCKLQIYLDRTADTFCGTPDYMAPEIIKGQHYNQNVDWWSFGVLVYEMLIGQSPFSGCDEDELFWSICNERPVLPRFLSKEACSVLTLLLEKDANKRLGNKFCTHGSIEDQPFFQDIAWDLLNLRQLDPPFKPILQHPLDTQYFDRTFTMEKAKLTPIDKTILQSMDQTQFQGFSYTNPNATDR